MMVAMAIEAHWWWILCDKHIIHMHIWVGSWKMNLQCREILNQETLYCIKILLLYQNLRPGEKLNTSTVKSCMFQLLVQTTFFTSTWNIILQSLWIPDKHQHMHFTFNNILV